MRDIAVFAIFAVGVLYALRNPYYGVLAWSLFNYMNPHRLAFGPAFNFPFVYIIAIVTIFSFLVARDKRPIELSSLLVLWIAFVLWMAFTTIFALEPQSAEHQLIKVIKIQVPIFMTLFLFYNKERIDQLIMIIAFSIGFYGFKGGLFTLATGGQYIVWGPDGSFIFGNNELAVALLTTTPLLMYLRRQTSNQWIRAFLVLAMVLMLISAIGTQSRGAFLALLAFGVYFWWQSDKKLVWLLGIAIFAGSMWFFVPQSWKDRMATIQNYEEDGSAMGRIRAWRYALSLANARPTGGGFNPWTKQHYLEYSPTFDPSYTAFVAHSIYFSVLGEHGWIGFVLYLAIYWLAWRSLGRVIREARGSPERAWMADLAQALRLGMIAYFVGGAFLSLAYFDLPWHFVALAVILRSLTRESATLRKGEQAVSGLDKGSLLGRGNPKGAWGR